MKFVLKQPLVVPEGWTAEVIAGNQGRFILITSGTKFRLTATLDLEVRGFRSGMSSHGRFMGAQHKGRGWQQRLCDDAVHYLTLVDRSDHKAIAKIAVRYR